MTFVLKKLYLLVMILNWLHYVLNLRFTTFYIYLFTQRRSSNKKKMFRLRNAAQLYKTILKIFRIV
jgi:hypothetical protein